MQHDHQSSIRYAEQRRTLGSLLADVPFHEGQGDLLRLQEAERLAGAFLSRATLPDPDSAEQAELHRLARELKRKAAEAAGRVKLRARGAAVSSNAGRGAPSTPAPWHGMAARERGRFPRERIY